MPVFFASADALLVSLKDTKIFSMTIPGKLQSYFACGKPIIASLNGIGAKLVEESKSGFTSKAEDAQALAESVYKFSKLSSAQKKELGNNARIYYEKEFERSRLIKRLIDIFDK